MSRAELKAPKPGLAELQARFAAAVLGTGAADGLVSGPCGLPPDEAIAIYRNNVLSNYRRALAASFPVLQRLVDSDCFLQTVDALVHEQPSTSGDVAAYGAYLPAFIGRHAPTAALPYLMDVARLEWAIEEAATAPDATTLDLGIFAVEAPEALHLALQPSARLLHSPWPIKAIWRANQPDSTDAQVDLARGAEHLLVIRRSDERNEDVSIESLGAAEYAWLAALAAGQPLGAALDAALAVDPAFDIAPALNHHALAGTFM